MDLNHIDLFTGIGGFSLACQWAGIQTEVMCENDRRCQDFLRKTYPGIPIIPDVREFNGTQWQGRFIITAGVPCQPASRAGKQRGKEDDRWLWEDTIRIVSEARPDWCLFENPIGIDDVGLGGILSDLEAIGYETAPPLIIPACAVNSPQIRKRYWIVAYSAWNGKRKTRADGERIRETGESCNLADNIDRGPERAGEQSEGCPQFDAQRDMAYTETTSRFGMQDGEKPETSSQDGRCYSDQWRNYEWTPCADGKLRRTPDNSFSLVNGLHRSVLGALGNSIVPQVAYEIIKATKETQ